MSSLGEKYTDDYAKASRNERLKDFEHTQKGILLSADPPYIYIKGRELGPSDIPTDTDIHSNLQVVSGDSIGLELNPQEQRLFAIYRHHNTGTKNNPV
jgi:hypothetical protein